MQEKIVLLPPANYEQQLKTEALAAAAPFIEPYKKTVKADYDYSNSLDIKYHEAAKKDAIKTQEWMKEHNPKNSDFQNPVWHQEQIDNIKTAKVGTLNIMNVASEEDKTKLQSLHNASYDAGVTLRKPM